MDDLISFSALIQYQMHSLCHYITASSPLDICIFMQRRHLMRSFGAWHWHCRKWQMVSQALLEERDSATVEMLEMRRYTA